MIGGDLERGDALGLHAPQEVDEVRAKELKAAGMDWTAVLAEEVENRRARLATEILASPAYDSTAARLAAFVQQEGGRRATFFNYRRRFVNGNGAGREPSP